MTTNTFQPGILAPLAAFGCSISFRLKPASDPGPDLSRLQKDFDPGWGVVGLGEPLVRRLGGAVSGLRTFPALAGSGLAVPSTQQALWVFLRADDRSTLFDRSTRLMRLLDGAFEVVDCQVGFRYQDGRDLTGYEDGTENPGPEESIGVAVVQEDGPLAGSSFVAVQRWSHDLRCFESHSRQEQDDIIGRRRDDNEELEDAPESAHVKRSAQESFDPEAFMVRRSMPWSNGQAQGLEFIAYGRSLDAFEQVLRRMLGLDDGIVDALFRFSRPVTGGYYWCPPVAAGRLDFSLVV